MCNRSIAALNFTYKEMFAIKFLFYTQQFCSLSYLLFIFLFILYTIYNIYCLYLKQTIKFQVVRNVKKKFSLYLFSSTLYSILFWFPDSYEATQVVEGFVLCLKVCWVSSVCSLKSIPDHSPPCWFLPGGWLC